MTRLIDADAFDAIINDDGTIDEYATETARNAMLIMPTIDAVPVVRCKDCKLLGHYSDGVPFCDHPDGLACIDPDDYCSRAERRADDLEADKRI